MIRIPRNNIEAEKHFQVIKPIIEKRINKVLKKHFIHYRKRAINLVPDIINYLNDLLDNNNLKKLILASPDELLVIRDRIAVANPNFILPDANENLILRSIFVVGAYDNADFDKLEFIKRINIDTCPYCNRNYIYYLTKNSCIKPQIDHFFPKSIYPFFAVSYYNLIPSCQTCNGFGAKEENDPIDHHLTSPYQTNNSDFDFTYKIKNINFLNPLLDKSSVQIDFRNRNKINGHINIFKLDELYQQHSDHLLELIIKSKVAYSEEYRKYLNTYKGLEFSKTEIDRMIIGNYSKEEDVHKRPLAKMYQDIAVELGLITR